MMSNDTTPSKRHDAQATQKSVTFAQTLEDYEQDMDELLDMSSSESGSDMAENDDAYVLGQTTAPANDGRGHIKSTYLERNDYKALLESLRTNEQHDTAKHLMSAAMLRQSRSDVSEGIADRKLRKGWTAWPLPPDQTIHAVGSERELCEELGAVIEGQLIRRLRAEDKEVSAEGLPDDLMQMVVAVMLQKMTSLLQQVGSSRTYQGGLADSTINRLDLLDHRHIISILKQTQSVSGTVVDRAAARCAELFGGQMLNDTGKRTRPKPVRMKDGDVVYEVAAGSGSWHLRGSKRRKLVDTTSAADETMCRTSCVATDLETGESGARFSREIQPVPRRLLKLEQEA